MVSRPPVKVPHLSPDLTAAIEERITEFERLHEADVLADGAGWVPRLRRSDVTVAVAVNALLVVWLLVAFLGGGSHA